MNDRVRVVGVGASAGGLEALERLFEHVVPSADWAWVVVQHLSPDHKSMMAEILGKRTTLKVTEGADGDPLEGGRIYLVPPHANLEVRAGRLKLIGRAAGHTLNLPVDVLFRSLAEDYAEHAIGVVLSGTGSDGRAGLEAIKQAGGLVLVQDPVSARFDGMPQAAVSTGLVDAVVPAERIGDELLRLTELGRMSFAPPPETMEQLHGLLKQATGIDFAEYKPTTVLRRVDHRMKTLGLDDLDEYLRRLEGDRAEVLRLGDELLINVTRFFRDPPAWDLLRVQVVQALLHLPPRETLRVWVSGCATGQEAYSLAMLLIEELPAGREFKIFATDVDNAALQVAATGFYSASDVEGLSKARLGRFFVPQDKGFVVDRELRRRIVFAPHNIARDPPFTRLDLITCRNLLIYLALPLQRRVLSTFAFALKPDAFLMLGPSESLGDLGDRFRTIDGQWKLYQRLQGGRSLPPPHPTALRVNPVTSPTPSDEQQAIDASFRLLMEKVAPTSLLASESLELVSVFGNAAQLLTVPTGTASLQVVPMLPGPLQTVVIMAAHRALSTNQECSIAVTHTETGIGAVRALPVMVGANLRRFVVLAFERTASLASTTVSVSDESERQVAELQRELGFVRESLQSTIEELETSNEELQATNEELLAANEELQSTNEELQSVNEELNTVNVEHQARIAELTQANQDLDNLFQSSTVGTLFLDEQLLIRRFTEPLGRVMSMMDRDIGRPVHHLASSLEDAAFLPDLSRVLTTGAHVEREVTRASGERFLLRMTPYLTTLRQIRGVVVSFIDVTPLRAAEETRRSLQVLIDSLLEHVAVIDSQGVIRFVNLAWSNFARANGTTGGGERVGVGTNYLRACESTPDVKAALTGVLAGSPEVFTWEYPCHSPEGPRWFLMHAARLSDGTGAVVSHLDITRRKLLEGAS